MTVKTYTKSILLIGLWVLSIGGLLLHCRIHPVNVNQSNFVPAVSCILAVLAVPIFFCFRRSIAYGYVLNGFLVIIGTITMAHFSFAHWPHPVTVQAVLLTTTLADILILWAKFFVGKAILDLEFLGYDAAREKKGITYRYPEYGMVACSSCGRKRCVLSRPFPVEVNMNQFKLFTLNWWILHILAIIFFFYLGHTVHF